MIIAIAIGLAISSTAYADQPAMPDMHAPIGVMGDHGHAAGELMLSYRYARMEMDGNRSGSSNRSTSEVLRDFPVSALDMSMDMHMFGAMYGLGGNTTLMAMLPYLDKSMNLVTRMGHRFKTEAKGLGDIKIMAMHKLYEKRFDDTHHQRLGISLGLSLPTGDTDKKDDTPAGHIRLPYPMQLGSGTYDPMLGMTYASFYPQWSWGAQLQTIQRLGKNDEGYRLGDEYHATTWAAYRHSDYLSAALRIDGRSWNNISGRDKELNPNMVPTARADLRGGQRADVGISVNFVKADGMFRGHRLAAEFLVPFYQHLDGPQLEVDYRYTLGWQAVF